MLISTFRQTMSFQFIIYHSEPRNASWKASLNSLNSTILKMQVEVFWLLRPCCATTQKTSTWSFTDVKILNLVYSTCIPMLLTFRTCLEFEVAGFWKRNCVYLPCFSEVLVVLNMSATVLPWRQFRSYTDKKMSFGKSVCLPAFLSVSDSTRGPSNLSPPTYFNDFICIEY